jgi:hypothetical protein
MIVATDRCRAVPLLPFLQTLFEIALLRKGPEHIPRSVVILAMAIALWFLSALTAFALIDRFDESDFFLEIFSALIAVACYSAIVIIARRGTRLTQTMSAIIGCGALLMSVFVAAYVLLQPLIGPGLMTLVAWLILLWSVSIKGHIIASAINRHWYIGLSIAVAVFVLQSIFVELVSSKP